MSEEPPNFSVFNSRILVDTVGDVTDEALKASRMKEVIGVLGGRLFNWGQRKSLFPLHLGIKCCALEMASCRSQPIRRRAIWCVFPLKSKAM